MTADQLRTSAGEVPAAQVSPQSATAAGNNATGAAPAQPAAPQQLSPIQRLLRGDLPGAVQGFIDQLKSQNPNFITPNDVNRTLKGDFQGRTSASQPAPSISPGTMATARAYMDPQGTQGLGTAQIRAGNLLPSPVPPLSGATAANFMRQNQPGAVSRETAGAGGAANAAGRKPTYPEWLSARGLSDSMQNRLRFNSEIQPFRNLRNQAPSSFDEQQMQIWPPSQPPPGVPVDRGSAVWTNERGQRIPAPGQWRQGDQIYQRPRSSGVTQSPDWVDQAQPYIPGGMNPPRVPPGAAGAEPLPPTRAQPSLPGAIDLPPKSPQPWPYIGKPNRPYGWSDPERRSQRGDTLNRVRKSQGKEPRLAFTKPSKVLKPKDERYHVPDEEFEPRPIPPPPRMPVRPSWRRENA
jgi:hypothetical protein